VMDPGSKVTYIGVQIGRVAKIDSVPSDLNAYLIYRRALDEGTGQLEDTTLVAAIKGAASGGPIDSGRAIMEAIAADPAKRRILSDPYSLSPERGREPDLGRQSDMATRRANTIDPSLHGWVTTFVMAAHNTKIVRRSNALLGWAYGKRFRYTEVMSAGKSAAAPIIAAGVTGAIVAGSAFGVLMSRGVGRKLLDRALPKPGSAPGEAAVTAGISP
jgi:short subunit dehydrogenase-like uncharacterized protein